MRFESSVNSEGIETLICINVEAVEFESSVNSEGIETIAYTAFSVSLFESSVNSEGIETAGCKTCKPDSLRAV